MNLSKILLGCVVLSSANLSALCIKNDVSLSVGLRQDDFKHSRRFIFDGDELIEANTRVKHANVWQIGGKFRFFMPDLSCCNSYNNCCDTSFLQNFYIKGYGYWGTNSSDVDVSRHLRFLSLTSSESDSASSDCDDRRFLTGRIKDYQTGDAQIGLGYLFDLGCLCDSSDFNLGLGILGGYSWHQQEIKNKRERCFISNEPLFKKLTNTWDGGWLGAELYYSACDTLINLGYEYHWANWEGKATLRDEFEIDSSDFRRNRNTSGSGNVVYLDATRDLCDCWDIGLGLKYSYFTANQKKRHDNTSDLTDDDIRGSKGTWQSWQLTVNVGYNW